ncbi:hypothetical protein Bca4012_101093 [Brassica carinata]
MAEPFVSFISLLLKTQPDYALAHPRQKPFNDTLRQAMRKRITVILQRSRPTPTTDTPRLQRFPSIYTDYLESKLMNSANSEEEYSNPRDLEVRIHYLEKEVKELWYRLRHISDRLSALPDTLITQILLYLPTKDSIKTNFLSKRFKDLWLQVPGLEMHSHELAAIQNFIATFLQINRGSRLQKFKITYNGRNVCSHGISEFIAGVINRGVQQLDVGSSTLKRPLTNDLVPVNIYKSNTLVSLKLANVGMQNPPEFGVSLPCLKTVHLEDITTKDPLIVEKLISGCPVLEDLTVFRAFDDNVPVLRVRSLSLKRFCVKFSRARTIHGKEYAVEVDAPGLKYLNFRDNLSDKVVAKNLSSLFKIDIDTQFSFGMSTTITVQIKQAIISDFLKGVSGVRHMIISQPTLKYLLYLKDLEPENLELTVVPQCLLCTLECVEVKEVATVEKAGKKRARYIKKTKVSKHKKKIWIELVRYILENSLVLKKLVLCFSSATNSVLEISEALPTFTEEYSNPRDLEVRIHYLEKEVKEQWYRLRDIRFSDRLSALPDTLIIQILLYLPTKDSIKTNFLSKRFKDLWLQVPGLELHSHEPAAIKNFIATFLQINRGSRLQRFKITYNGRNVCLHGTSEFIAGVINRGVQQLDVGSGTLKRPLTNDLVPVNIYKSNTLVSLKLANVGMQNPPEFGVSLPCLKTMHLEDIITKDPLIVEKLISGCPVLEDLTVFRVFDDNVPVLRVRSLSLKRFCVKFSRARTIHGKEYAVEVDAPGLKYMNFRDDLSDKVVVKNLSSLFKVDIDTQFGTSTLQVKKAIICDFLKGIPSVRHMIISQPTLEVLYSCMKHGPFTKFCNLTRLEASFCTVLLQTLPYFLQGCPKLKHLTLHLLYLKDSEPANLELTVVPQCLLCTLECVEVNEVATVEKAGKKRARYIKRTKVSKHKKKIWTELVRYILENSLVLKKLVLCFSSVTNSVLEISEALPTFTIRSPGCEIFNHLTSI